VWKALRDYLMNTRFFSSLILLFAILLGGTATASNLPIPVTLLHENAIGHYAGFLKEADGALTLDQAIAAYASGNFLAANNPILNFGIGSKSVWIHFSVGNATPQPIQRRLSIETAWLDQVDVYFRHHDNTTAAYHVGDTKAFQLRPIDSRYFVFDHAFESGVSDVFVRVATPDPMVVPIYLMSPEQAHAKETQQDYSYGFLYGFLFALLAYNVMLYAGLRDSRYILYSLYLCMFLLMNGSYTGHGFMWVWPEYVRWEQWSNPVLIMLYGASGLIFALSFLETRAYFPRAHKAVIGYLSVSTVLLLLAVLFDSQRYALLIAFIFALLFTSIMLMLGVMAARSGQKPAQYFLLAAIAAMVGAALTTLSVWGFIPINIWTFRAVEIGILLDATLLALALTYQFRVGQEAKLRAEQLATLDPLTGINNRRAFYDKVIPIWNVTQRHNRNLSLILLDIDNFKRVNDAYGHAYGDEALKAMAGVVMKSIRDHDVAARWGGEEFILLLPETDIQEAAALAERLRSAIAGIRLSHAGAEIAVTASFGVVQRETHHNTLDVLISTADKYLYQSKEMGRNRVSSAPLLA
jgi:diguanylate cyclase (GGDEF)-like protein